MASSRYVSSLIGGLAAEIKLALTRIFEHVLDHGIVIGRASDQTASVNLAGHFYWVTTPAVADTEFTVAHRFQASAPYLLMQVLPLDAVGSQIVPLKVTRVADTNRVYLSSSTASAPICIYVEGS